ncbi:Mif2/CENP-C-like protein [Ceratobasidium sp. AG-Ba]|nr:Mif2/CENP-C-like protein [Ceratobasidium sp. AG-Ba]
MDDRRKSRLEAPKSALAFVDDENRGRRTGKLIPTVHRDEDGFESIESLFGSQAYSVNDPKRNQRKKSAGAALATVAEASYIDEGSDMDITQVVNDEPDEMDDYDIPEASAPLPARRTVRRSSPLAIDHVPSPRGSKYYSESSQLSQSTRRARAPLNSAIHRSHSAHRSSSPPQSISPPPASRSRRGTLANGNVSADMDLDEEEEEEEQYSTAQPAIEEEEQEVIPDPSSPRHPSRKSMKPQPKARPRTPSPEPDPDMEDDIAAGLAEVDAGPPESDEEPEPEPPKKDKGKGKEETVKIKKSPSKRTRTEEEAEEGAASPKKRPRGRPQKENIGARNTVIPVGGKRKKRDFNASTPPNVRRSQRERFSPLEWWRNEKFVYGRSPDPDEGPLLVPLIKGIERPPKPSPVPLSKNHRARRGRSVKVKKEEDEGSSGWLNAGGVFGAPKAVEDGMDEDTEELGVVMDYATGKEVERRIAFPGARVEFTATDGPFHFQKIFGDSDFFAAGVMKIPVGGRKPNKPSKENTYVFYCVSGAVEVKVHKSTFVIAPGGMFLAPRGNVYTIANVSERDAYIFFAQSRKVLDNSDEPPPLPREPSTSGEVKKTKAKVVPSRR